MSTRILTLALLGLATTAGLAPAQFYRYGSQWGGAYFAPSPYGGFYFNTYQSRQFAVQAMLNGQPITFQYQYSYSGLPRPNYYYAPAYYGNPYSSLSGGSGSFGSDQYNPIANRQRAAIARAQRAMDNNPAGGGKGDIEKWVAAQQQDRGKDPAAAVPLPIDPALLDPPDDAILSGKALNELAALCRKQEKAGRRAESGLCPPDLLEKVVFEGGAAAGVNLFRKTSLPYPSVVLVPETERLRATLDADFTAVGQALRAGKRANSFAVDRLETNITAARHALTARMKDAPFAQAKEVNDFLTRLATAARFARSANASAALPASWNTTGATVAELLRLMDRFKLRFGPAPAGGEPAYLSLHRGLLEYYVHLNPVKKK